LVKNLTPVFSQVTLKRMGQTLEKMCETTHSTICFMKIGQLKFQRSFIFPGTSLPSPLFSNISVLFET